MSIVKLNTAAPGTGSPSGSTGGGGLGLLAGIAVIGLGIWAMMTYLGNDKPKTEEPAPEVTE